jgi:hypothetical protein
MYFKNQVEGQKIRGNQQFGSRFKESYWEGTLPGGTRNGGGRIHSTQLIRREEEEKN